MNIKDAYIHNGEAILKDIQISGSKLQKLKAGKNADDTYLTWVDVLDLSPFGASGHNHDDRYVKKSGDTMTGLLTTTSGNNHKGIKVGNTYINAINGDLIFQNNGTIRFGGDSWDYNVWAGLKYVHSSKTIYLGLADGSAFTANSAQSGGKLYTPGISDIYIGNGTYTVYHTNNLSIKTLMGTTAIGDSDEPVYWNGSSFVKAGAYPTKASWNYDDRYLKLTGGKITGPVTFEMSNDRKIYINNSDNETYRSLISFQQKGTEYGTLGTAGSTDLQWNGHNLYHAGNLTASVIGGLGTLSNNISGNAATATKANSIITEQGTSNVYRNVFFAYDGDKTKVVYDDDFTYNPGTNTLKIGTGTLTATNYSGNAATATKIGTSTVGSATMPVYIKSGTPTAITSFPEAYLSWGGTNTSGSVTPIGMTLSSEHSANRLAFINGNALTFEYSSDAGSTWTDYGYAASTKSQVFTKSYDVPIGRANSSTEYTTNSRTRITLTAQNGTNSYVYTNPRKMLINIGSSGGMQVLIEYRTGTNYKNNGAWTTFGTYTLSGWSGWNDIPLVLNTLGGGSTQTSNNWQLRLTFIMTRKNDNYPKSASVNCIRIFGENAWTSPSTMAATGHLYTYDASQNATFPAAITSTKFVKSGGTSSQFLKADGSVDSNTYSKSNHTHSSILDINDSNVTTFAYSKSGLNYGDYTWLAGWNGYELRAINKSQFAQASHTHTKSQITDFAHTHTKSQITDFPSSLPASDVYSWAKQSTKPSYTGSEVKLTGYSKASSYSVIAASDTVNQAIGKLEGAISGLEELLASI